MCAKKLEHPYECIGDMRFFFPTIDFDEIALVLAVDNSRLNSCEPAVNFVLSCYNT